MATHFQQHPKTSSAPRFSVRGDQAPPERWQHSGYALERTERTGVLALRATEENALDVLGLKNLLSPRQIKAGLKFREDYHASGLGEHVTASYTGQRRSRDAFWTPHERTDAEEAAYRRWRQALEVLDKNVRQPFIATVCYDALPTARSLLFLQDGLDRLAALYKLKT